MSARTMPKGKPTAKQSVRGITTRRSFGGHQQPRGKHARARLDGVAWLGTSRIVDRPARRRSQRATFAALRDTARREYLASKRAA